MTKIVCNLTCEMDVRNQSGWAFDTSFIPCGDSSSLLTLAESENNMTIGEQTFDKSPTVSNSSFFELVITQTWCGDFVHAYLRMSDVLEPPAGEISCATPNPKR